MHSQRRKQTESPRDHYLDIIFITLLAMITDYHARLYRPITYLYVCMYVCVCVCNCTELHNNLYLNLFCFLCS